MRWKTAAIKKIVEDAVNVLPDKPTKILVADCGGDYDSEGLQIQYGKGGEFLNMCGFHIETTNSEKGNTPSDMEIEMVEVSDGQDSRGGLNSKDHRVCMAYGAICGALRRAGFDVVPKMKDYF